MIYQSFKIKFLFFLFFALFILICLIFCLKFNQIYYRKAKLVINKEEFIVEIADNNLKRKNGLGNRNYLCEKCGMLFTFSEGKYHGFWMKNMQFDLDILWLKNGKIVHIEENVSHNNQEIIYEPKVESDSVLELNSKTLEKFKIKLGDEVKIN